MILQDGTGHRFFVFLYLFKRFIYYHLEILLLPFVVLFVIQSEGDTTHFDRFGVIITKDKRKKL